MSLSLRVRKLGLNETYNEEGSLDNHPNFVS